MSDLFQHDSLKNMFLACESVISFCYTYLFIYLRKNAIIISTQLLLIVALECHRLK